MGRIILLVSKKLFHKTSPVGKLASSLSKNFNFFKVRSSEAVILTFSIVTEIIMHLVVLDFSWHNCNTQEKLTTMVM